MFPLILRTNLLEWKINLSDTIKNNFHCNFFRKKINMHNDEQHQRHSVH